MFVKRIHYGVLLVLLGSVLLLPGTAQAREIKDMAGRMVVVPDTIARVFCSSPPSQYLLYAMDSTRTAGLNFPINAQEREYLRKEYVNLPVVGGWFGQGQTPNLEAVMAAKPDIILAWYWHKSASNDVIEKTAQTLGVPVVYVRLDSLEQYAQAFEFMGDLLNLQKRGQILASETRRLLADVAPALAKVPKDNPVSVFYAQGLDGLRTDCDISVHAELIPLAGGRNIHHCENRDGFGMEQITFEQVMVGNPDVILAKEDAFAAQVRQDPKWRQLRAIRDNNVVSIPSAPFNWFDRPPSFMRILGLCWLTNKLYPELYPKDMIREAKAFYKLFLDIELDDAAARRVLKL